MGAIRNAVFTACLCAIITSAVRMISAERLKNELRLVCALVLIICIAVQLKGEDMKLSISELNLSDDSDYAQLSEDFSQAVVLETQHSLERTVKEKLTGQGIEVKKIGIDCTLDEYNSVEAARACIYLSEDAQPADIKAAESAAALLLPETEIEVICGDG
jgi:hypothetical protein